MASMIDLSGVVPPFQGSGFRAIAYLYCLGLQVTVIVSKASALPRTPNCQRETSVTASISKHPQLSIEV